MKHDELPAELRAMQTPFETYGLEEATVEVEAERLEKAALMDK